MAAAGTNLQRLISQRPRNCSQEERPGDPPGERPSRGRWTLFSFHLRPVNSAFCGPTSVPGTIKERIPWLPLNTSATPDKDCDCGNSLGVGTERYLRIDTGGNFGGNSGAGNAR